MSGNGSIKHFKHDGGTRSRQDMNENTTWNDHLIQKKGEGDKNVPVPERGIEVDERWRRREEEISRWENNDLKFNFPLSSLLLTPPLEGSPMPHLRPFYSPLRGTFLASSVLPRGGPYGRMTEDVARVSIRTTWHPSIGSSDRPRWEGHALLPIPCRRLSSGFFHGPKQTLINSGPSPFFIKRNVEPKHITRLELLHCSRSTHSWPFSLPC